MEKEGDRLYEGQGIRTLKEKHRTIREDRS